MKRSKRYQTVSQKTDKDKFYTIDEAIKLVKDTSTTKFDSSVEVHVRTGIDVTKGEQQIRSSVTLPNGTGKTKKIAAIVGAGKEDEAKKAGADIIGGEDMIAEIKKTGKIDFDIVVTTPDMMSKLAVIAKILGPRGLMPSPKNETITTNLEKTIDELKKGKVNYKNDDTGNVHQIIGKSSFTEAQIKENLEVFIEALRKAKPASSKGTYIKSVSICSTMGPAARIQL